MFHPNVVTVWLTGLFFKTLLLLLVICFAVVAGFLCAFFFFFLVVVSRGWGWEGGCFILFCFVVYLFASVCVYVCFVLFVCFF